jgi:hypothetical protein
VVKCFRVIVNDGAGFGKKWELLVPVTFPKDGGKLWRLQNNRFEIGLFINFGS